MRQFPVLIEVYFYILKYFVCKRRLLIMKAFC